MRLHPVIACTSFLLFFTAGSAGVASGPRKASDDRAGLPSMGETLWQDPGPIAALDLVNGVGGNAHVPSPAGRFTFAGEDDTATSPKFDVTDEAGVVWKVKLGDESKPETAATRFLWAAGYLVDEVYYLETMTVTDLPELKRGREFVSPGGTVRGARLERRRPKDTKSGDWDWFENPFVGTKELNGLRVMMSLLNSWDLKKINNAIFVVGGQRQYMVSDLGGTFGKTGDALTRTKGASKDYDESKFIAKVMPDAIDFVLHSRPHFLGVVDVANYRERTKMEQITKDIPRADVKWLAGRLSLLTDAQIRDGFRAAGFVGADLETFSRVMRRRIAELGAL
jgi:hypothetical protein